MFVEVGQAMTRIGTPMARNAFTIGIPMWGPAPIIAKDLKSTSDMLCCVGYWILDFAIMDIISLYIFRQIVRFEAL